MTLKQQQLLDLLLAKDVISEKKFTELSSLIKGKRVDLIKVMLQDKVLDEEKLTEYNAEVSGLPYKNLLSSNVVEETLNFISEDIAKTYSAICFQRALKRVDIGLLNPNPKAMEAINFLAKGSDVKINYYLISRSSFDKVFKQYQKIEEEISSALEIKAKEEGEDFLQINEDENELTNPDDINSAPVAKIVAVIIRHAVEGRASDIHIEPFENESRIRYRIDGILHTSLVLPKHIHNAVAARIKVLARLKLDETRVPQDGRIRLIIDGRQIDFRVSTLPVGKHEKVVMRILDNATTKVKLNELGFNKHNLRVIKRTIKKTNGILLVTGPTGSGKTTTLYAILRLLNKEGVNISTLEDPVEYQLKGINQSQVRPKIGYTFASGLRSFLRQDPDIIMVGEIRDEETGELAVHAGLTGHFVLSTLHTNDAIGTVMRLLDMDIEPFLLASTLRLAVAQRLGRKLCYHCRKAVKMSEIIAKDFQATFADLPPGTWEEEMDEKHKIEGLKDMKIYEAVGCSRCDNTGYNGRVAITEALEVVESIQRLIEKGDQNITIKQVRESQKFVSIKQDGFIKILKGITSMDEVLRVTQS